MRLARLLLLLLAVISAHAASRTYLAADGTRVRRPHVYKRHPNRGTAWTATCKDGAITFSHSRTGACSHHGGVRSWR